jgi:hypothetical protein
MSFGRAMEDPIRVFANGQSASGGETAEPEFEVTQTSDTVC